MGYDDIVAYLSCVKCFVSPLTLSVSFMSLSSVGVLMTFMMLTTPQAKGIL